MCILQPGREEMCNSFHSHPRVDTCRNNKISLKITCRLKLNINYLGSHIYI